MDQHTNRGGHRSLNSNTKRLTGLDRLRALAGPTGIWEPGPETASGWRSSVSRGGNAEQVDLTTLRFLKHRASESRHAYFLTYDATHPAFGARILHYSSVYVVEADPSGGWRVRGSAGGAGDPPKRQTPSVNLGGGAWPDRFFAGGWVERAGTQLDRVELRFANAVTLDDDCADGVALFITDRSVALPATAVMLDHNRNQIAEHAAFPGE